jgi:hypothetical protein
MSTLPRLCGVLAACALALVGTAAARGQRIKLPKGVTTPNDTVLAIYLPASMLQARFYLAQPGLWIEPGVALVTARDELGATLFREVRLVPRDGDRPYGLLLDIDPSWNVENGKVTLDLSYAVYGPGGKQLHAGEQRHKAGFNKGGTGGGITNVALQAMQLVLVDVLRKLEPSATKFPAGGTIGAIPPELLVDKEEAVRTGTGFYINASGQLLTAAHVLRDCLLVEASSAGQRFSVKQGATSDLLDLAVVDSGRPTQAALPLRAGQTLELGEMVTNVSYPLQGLLEATPNVTRGNVSASSGLKGSVGMFQFSAPIQPGASGGPVVSDSGELLGVTVGTLNAQALVESGVLPQNVNFALDARHAAQFLRNHQIAFEEVAPTTAGEMSIANKAALAAVVQLSCYQ